jgi:class 3 adenylate cyclase/tetratricopeptide (TPR) repeat protein
MRCPSCHCENPENARFCIECGAAFERRCLKCGFDHLPRAKFCSQCGSSFTEPATAETSSVSTTNVAANGAPRRIEQDGERRHLTVLFCDLVGSTAIAAQLDPEEWRETVAGYHRAAAAAITSFDGHVAKFIGDGVMALFGWPQAHDNDAERAARAGLAILDAITKLNEQPRYAKLSVRVGIDSGPVVMGKGAGSEVDVFGDTSNIASRVEGEAAPGTVAITDATHRLLSGLFVVEDCGAHELKGIEQPVQLYRVIRPSGARGRFEAATAAGGLTPFVGREDELRTLTGRWQRALDGDGQVALIIGEAGIGKSRLVQRFHEQIADTPHTWIGAGAGAFFQNTPFYPVVEMVRQFLGDVPPQDQLAQLEPRLELAGLKPAEAIPLIAPLLNLALPTQYPPSTLSPEQQRRRLLATLVEWVLGSARARPLVIATEDLHWVDPSTLELIQLLVEQGATARLLLLYTARPEFHAPWPMRAHHTQITLNRLSAGNVRTMVAQVAASKALTDDTIATVIERTGGIPLFVEELTRDMLERGGGGTPREIPATLHDSLMARLDRLGPDKEVLQIGAVMGSEFSYELLHAIHPMAETDLQRALRAGTDAELLYVRGIAPDSTYQFKHALIRDAAYEALLKSRRKELHRTVARTIDEQFPTLKESHPEVLARHWTEAGEEEPAIAEWSRAGKTAESRNAFKEALESYQQALALLKMSPESHERNIRELEISQSVVSLLYVIKGYAARETIEATEYAAALAEKSGNLTQLVDVMVSRGFTAYFSGDIMAAGALADRGLELALREGGSTNHRLRRLYTLLILTRYWHGDLAGVDRHFTAGLKFFDDPVIIRRDNIGAPIAAFAHASWSAWMLGRASAARERIAQMMSATDQNNPFEMAFADYFTAVLNLYLREFVPATASAARALELSENHRYPYIAASSRCALGQALAEQGRAADGIELIRTGIAGLLDIGSRAGISRSTTYLAAAQERDGATVDALETVERALQVSPDELNYRPETLRIRGELRLKQGQRELAEAAFLEAIALAQRMSAKAWELRATTSLARLLASQGRSDEARPMLADIYNWFTEGFHTADLKDAKALLERLDAEP